MSRAYKEAQEMLGPGATKEDILEAISPVYEPDHGRTKQAFKDTTDINKIMDRARKTGVISHVGKYGAEYGDFSDIPDLMEAQKRLIRANEIFADLPGEVRREFDQDSAKFFAWVNDPANADKVEAKLSDVARRGNQLPVVRGNSNAAVGGGSEPQANVSTTPVPAGTGDVNAAPAASEG